MENDPLKELLRNLPEIEPSKNLKKRILQSIETNAPQKELWILKPAMVSASYLMIALLGTVLSVNILEKRANGSSQIPLVKTDGYRVSGAYGSPILQWAQTRSDIEFFKRPI